MFLQMIELFIYSGHCVSPISLEKSVLKLYEKFGVKMLFFSYIVTVRFFFLFLYNSVVACRSVWIPVLSEELGR